MNNADAIAALADPSRRAIVDQLRGGPLPVGVIAAELPISRPAVSQHLKILTDAGLLRVATNGNRRFYQISPEGVDAIRSYFDSLWDDALRAFEAQSQSKRKDLP